MIKLLHCYDDLLNLYGDYANVSVLARRLREEGEDVKIEKFSIGSVVDFSDKSFIYFGAGTEKNIITALEDVRRVRRELSDYIACGGTLLATGNSVALFGDRINCLDGVSREGLGFIRAEFTEIEKRQYTELILKTPIIEKPVVATVNTSYSISFNDETLFFIEYDSNKLLEEREGLRKGNAFFTRLSGPVLVRNPELLEFFAHSVSGRRLSEPHQDWNYSAERGYEHMLNTLTKAREKEEDEQ